MKTSDSTKFWSTRSISSLLVVTLLLGITAIAQEAAAQSPYKVITTSQIKVSGTSNLHDWDMSANNFACEGDFTVSNGILKDLSSMTFTLPVTSLKSKEKLMDTRAYKALNAEKFKTITFKLTDATVVPQQKIIKATGNLTISGVTKPVTIQSTYVVNEDGSITCKGSKAIKMSSHGMKAPSFMMGALKTGDDVTIDILLKLKK